MGLLREMVERASWSLFTSLMRSSMAAMLLVLLLLARVSGCARVLAGINLVREEAFFRGILYLLLDCVWMENKQYFLIGAPLTTIFEWSTPSTNNVSRLRCACTNDVLFVAILIGANYALLLDLPKISLCPY
jgi:hypothetical protein